MLEILKQAEFLNESDTIKETPICKGISEFLVNDKELYIVCDEEGEEAILRNYREASIEAAMTDIPEVYYDFFEFNEFAEYSWQSIYDVYDKVVEVEYLNKKYYICSV